MKTTKIQLKAICEKSADGVLRIVASDETIDRSGESIPFESWDLSKIADRGVKLLIDHDYSVGSVVGKSSVVKDDKRKAIILENPVFHTITQAARELKEMVDGGWIDEVSVGFLRHEDQKGVARNELMEVSFVAVPANPSARTLSMKSVNEAEAKAIEDFVKDVGEDAEEPADAEDPAEGDACTMEDGAEGMMGTDDEGKLVCMIPKKEKAAEVQQKGIIDDALSADGETRKLKYPYLDAICYKWWAFTAAYMLATTKVEDLPAMVADFSAQIAAIAAGAAPAEPVLDEPAMMAMKAFMERKGYAVEKSEQVVITGTPAEPVESVEKAGRVLSKKNRGIISTAKDALASGIVALEELLKATESAEEDTSEGDEETKKAKPAPSREDKSYQAFIELRKVMRAVNTGISDALKDAKL